MKLELTISKGYVPTWTLVDAVRELFQNAIDQEVQDPTNTMSWEYDEDAETLRICNAKSKLTTDTLLLGTTSKANNTDTIGQFGEGYKIATLVLIRCGFGVTFYNQAAKQIWRPRFVKSRRYGAEVLTFFIENELLTRRSEHELCIEVTGVTSDDWSDIKASNLRLRDDYNVMYTCAHGEVLDIPGKVFVNGLFVTNHKSYTYSYNFKPGHIKLDRDRKMASDFELQWAASKVWATLLSSGVSPADVQRHVNELALTNAGDITYIHDLMYKSIDYFYNEFISTHGANAVPVADQWDLLAVPAGYVGVVVPNVYRRLVKGSALWVEPTIQSEPAPLRLWFDKYCNQLSSEAYDELVEIMEELNV